MTFKDGIARDDKNVFENKDEFAVEAIYYENAVGNGRPVIGYFGNEYVEIAAGDPGIGGTKPLFEVRSINIPNVVRDDTFKFKAADVHLTVDTTFAVTDIQPNVQGDWKTLILERQ